MNLDCNYNPLIGPVKDNIKNKTIKRLARPEELFCTPKAKDAISDMYEKALKRDWQGVYPTIRYYEEAVKFPAKARLVFNDVISEKIVDNLGDAYIENSMGNRSAFKTFIENQHTFIQEHAKCNEHSIVQKSKDNFLNKLGELYPRSYPKREAILKHRAVILDEVIPKFTGIKKFFLKIDAKKYLKLML